MKNIRPIRTEVDLSWALTEIEPYFVSNPEPGTPDADRFDVLTDLIETYENRHYPIEPLDPVDAIQSYMDEHQKNAAELAVVIGSKSRASEILSRKRTMSLATIRRINEAWKIPAATLIRPYHAED